MLGASKLNFNKQLLKRMDDVIIRDSEVTWLVEFHLSVLIDYILENDENITFFVLVFTLDAASPVNKSAHHVQQCKDILPPTLCESSKNAKFLI